MAAPAGTNRIEEVTFSAEGFVLRGSLHLPAAPRPPVVVGCHGLLSDRRSPKQLALASALTARGLAYLRFDHRGCGESGGRPADGASLAARRGDLVAAVEMLHARGDLAAATGLFGSSMGGAACLSAASRGGIAALVTFAAPVRSSELRARSGDAGGRLLSAEFDITPALHAVRGVLVFHGDADEVVPLAHGREIHRLAGAPKRLVVQEKGDHLMSDRRHQEAFVQAAADWLTAGLLGSEPA